VSGRRKGLESLLSDLAKAQPSLAFKKIADEYKKNKKFPANYKLQEIDSIKKETRKDIDIYNLPLNDKKVFKALCKGFTQDVFQFGSKGLAEYIFEVQPNNVNDLIVAVALYRPGAMESGFHQKWIKIKEGLEEPNFIKGWEDITKDTNGLLIYQEQTMFVCQKVGGFDLEETDNIRRALGKKKPELLESYKQRFIDGGLKNGFSQEDLEFQWEFIEKTSGYQFNKSHAACYALMGYISVWFKVNYPTYFWTTSFSLLSQSKKDEKIPAYISEIYRSGDISLKPVDINKSGNGFTSDFKNNSIYWSLNSVKQCGDKAVEQLVKDKEEKGEYFDFKEFLQRNVTKGSKVTKQVIENLVLSGAFDELENIHQTKDRERLINFYREEYKIKTDKEKDIFTVNKSSLQYNWWWSMMQKRISGFALFDFKLVCDNFLNSTYKYENELKASEGDMIKTCGYINEIIVRNSKKGEYADVILDNNFEFIIVKLWAEQWKKAKELIDQKEKCLMCITGKVNFDNYKQKHILTVNDDSEILILE
jgi:DNA polymerase-3 subunit alpha